MPGLRREPNALASGERENQGPQRAPAAHFERDCFLRSV